MLSEWWSDVTYRARALFRRDAVERELDDELRDHLERATAAGIAAGLDPDEARRRARVALGGVERTKEDDRDARGVRLLEILLQDVRYAVRGLRARPGFATAVVLTLGLGIGANAAMFGIVDRLLFRPPAYLRDPGAVHRVYLQWQADGRLRSESILEYTRYLDFATWTTSFSQMTAFTARTAPVGTGTDARELPVATVGGTFFDFFDLHPALGRFFTTAEDSVPFGRPVAVLSYAYWQSRYGGRLDVLGTPLQLGPISCTIIGVAPRGFVGIQDEEPPVAFIPITAFAGVFRASNPTSYFTNYNWGWMSVLARRKPGVSVAAASADLTQAYQRSYEKERGMSPQLAPASVFQPRALAAPVQLGRGPNAGRDVAVIQWVGGIALIVLLIACANVANLFLARVLSRRRELALRQALGGSRARLALQLLTESVLLAVLGGGAGVLIAAWGGDVMGALFLPSGERLHVLGDGRTLLFTAVAAIGAGLLTGLAPVLTAERADLVETLKGGVREGTHRRSGLRTALLIFQGTLSVVLLVGAGLFVQSLRNVRALPLGYDIDPVLFVELRMRGHNLPDSLQAALARRLVESVGAVPGVTIAARGVTVPFWDTWGQGFTVPGIDSVRRLGRFTLQAGSPEYFRTVGTRILRGRGITTADRRDAPGVVVVTTTMARTLWPGQDAIGKCMKFGGDTSPCTTVVGISEDIKQNSLTEDGGLHYFLPIEQFHPEAAVLFVRAAGGDARAIAEPVRRTLQPLMPGDAYIVATLMRDVVDPNLRAWQLGSTMFIAFGGLALVLAAIGLYSVIAYSVAQRTHELGVRMALGAQVGDLVRLVVGEGMRYAVIGIASGSLIAVGAGRWVTPLLFAESPRDPVVFGGVAGVLLVTALAASGVPAVRASRVDPNSALRVE